MRIAADLFRDPRDWNGFATLAKMRPTTSTCLAELGSSVLTVNHDSNSFTDPANRKKGHLVDFICAWWGVSPREIFRDIVPYRLYLLYHETENEKSAP